MLCDRGTFVTVRKILHKNWEELRGIEGVT